VVKARLAAREFVLHFSTPDLAAIATTRCSKGRGWWSPPPTARSWRAASTRWVRSAEDLLVKNDPLRFIIALPDTTRCSPWQQHHQRRHRPAGPVARAHAVIANAADRVERPTPRRGSRFARPGELAHAQRRAGAQAGGLPVASTAVCCWATSR
jgi:hypothetical protein